MSIRILLIAAILATGCASTNEYVYKLYPGPERPDAELVTLVFGDNVYVATIDGLHVDRLDYGTVKLLPGEHTVAYGAVFGTSVLVNPEKQRRIFSSTTIRS